MAESRVFCFGFGPWKFGFVRAYLATQKLRATFCSRTWQARLLGFDEDAKIVVWGARERAEVQELSADYQVPIWRMEDGFLRSVGLGSDFNVPASLVLDRRGIYFDPNQPSDLEVMLEAAAFDAEQLVRAAALREAIVGRALSKYNFATQGAPLTRPDGRRVILVPGQVEDDASIRLGCVDIRTNEALLSEARRQNPEAHLIFKPHPDVLSGNRKKGALSLERSRELCDQLVLDASLPACLAIADEVHTMTSLVGFEALLRGILVSTYGKPFYAGWGLTIDRHRVERRTRKLSLDQLVAGALIGYPLYLDRRTNLPSTPEAVVAELGSELVARGKLHRIPPWRRRARKLALAIRGALRGS